MSAGWFLALLLLTGDVVAGPGYVGSNPIDRMGHETTIRYQRSEWPWTQAGCQTTRTRVLIRDAQAVELDAAKCRVVAGAWTDRLTGLATTDSRQLDIDHTVPLAWAHRHGGAGWTREEKRAYANQLGYRYALQAVDLHANRAKGDKGPEAWRPPNEAAHCAYGHAWATVLIIWDLTPDPATRAAIRELVTRC